MNNTSRPLRAARYVRNSTVDQNPNLQLDETAQLIDRRGWSLTDTYLDHGISGSKERRPELDRLMADAKRRKFDVLVAWRSDRLFRSLKFMVTMLDELSALGIAYVSVTEPFDATTPAGKLLIHLVASMAEFEKSILQERVRAGIAASKRRGVLMGRPHAKFDLEEARRLRAMGKSFREVSRAVGVGVATIHRALGSSDS
jgi:DNA invertase Pin-like site-specific DNA recombinase